MTFKKALDEHGQEITLPVSGAVLDNTIANPSLITVPGTYIVPQGVVSGVFVGQEGKLAEFNGETFTFRNAPIGFKAQINLGDNTGSIASFDGTTWTTADAGGGVVVSGSIIDNTIGNPDNITTAGRYIVPATGTTGAFVGQENQYADWYGELDEVTTLPIGITFSAPENGDKVVITSGANAGKIFSYNAGVWTEEAGTASIPSSGQSLAIVDAATIFSSGGNPPWSDVNGGLFTIPGPGRWNIEYNLSVTNNTSNWQQARLLSATGVLVNGSISGEGPQGVNNSPITLTGFAQVDTNAASTFKLQARTFNGSTLTIRNTNSSNTGQSIVRWTKAVDFPIVAVAPNIIIEQNYINVSNSVDVANLTTNSDLVFDVQVSRAGAVQYNPTTRVFSGLKSGKTYDLSAYFAFSSFSNTTNGYVVVQWVNSATNTTLPNIGKALLLPVNRGTNETIQSFAGGIFTAPSDMSVKLRIVASDGTATMRGQNFSSASIQEVTGVALDPALVPVNDQTDSGFFDLGTARYQWGIAPAGSGFRTITFPAPFANTSYAFTTSVAYVDATPRVVVHNAPTTTSIQVRAQSTGGSESTAEVRWIAIGRKP